jgi:hypothetical protein
MRSAVAAPLSVHVEERGGGADAARVDAPVPQRHDQIVRFPSGDLRGDDRAQLGAAVQDAHPRHLAELLPQPDREEAVVAHGLLHPHLARLAGRGPHPEHQRVGELPVLEAAGVGREIKGVGRGPPRPTHVREEWRTSLLQHAVGDVEEPDPPGTAEELARRPRQEIAAEVGDIHRELPHRLAGIDQVGDAVLRADPSHLRGRLDQPGVGGHVGEGYERRAAAAKMLPDGVGIHASLGVVGDPGDPHAAAPGQREVHQLIGDVVVPRGEDLVAIGEVEGGERLGHGDRRVLDDGDVAAPDTDQDCGLVVRRLDLGCAGVGGLVSPDLRLQAEVVGDRRDHLRGHQGGAGVVQVDHG